MKSILSHRPSHFDGNLSHRPSHADVKYMKSPADEDKQSSFPNNFWMPPPLPPPAYIATKKEDSKNTESKEDKTDLNNNSLH